MYWLSLDVGATKTVIAIARDERTVLHRTRLSTIDALQADAAPAGSLAASIRSFCQQAGIELSTVEGVGIGFPGVMDRTSERIISCPNLPVLDGYPLGPDLAEQLGVPVLVENDLNLIALGEHFTGRGKGVDDFACIYVGSGIGCGLVLNGHLYTGADGAAGELGHTVIEPEGRPCTCGRRGCLEMYCSGKALALQAPSVLDQEVDEGRPQADKAAIHYADAELVIQAAKTGQEPALKAMRQAFHYLGLGIANLANIMNPRLVILGGGVVAGWPDGIEVVRETVRMWAHPVVRDRLVIDMPLLGENAGIIGAFVLLEDSLSRQ